jgi:GDPmannose 4,6-dehydratase
MATANAKRALIVGAAGQDGAYLADLLISRGYAVLGLVRDISVLSTYPININIEIQSVDLSSQIEVGSLLANWQPNEIYYLATSHESSLEFVFYDQIFSINTRSLAIFLDQIHKQGLAAKLFYASSSNIFMDTKESPQSELTPFSPLTVYGAAKVTAMNLIRAYRQKYGVFACSGILYNHESPRRKEHYLPRKVSKGIARILDGSATDLILGQLNTIRDWGHARDYVKAMWMMLQSPEPVDYIIGSGQARTVRELLEIAFSSAGLRWERYVKTTVDLDRPENSVPLIANTSKISYELGWRPETSFENLIVEMVMHDCSTNKLAERT